MVARIAWVVQHEGSVQPPVDLDSAVGMEEVGSGMGCDELVGEGTLGGDGVLSDTRHTVGGVAQGNAVPVHRGGCGELVVDRDPEQVARLAAQDVPVEFVGVGPGLGQDTAQVQGDRARGQGVGDGRRPGRGGEWCLGRDGPCGRGGAGRGGLLGAACSQGAGGCQAEAGEQGLSASDRVHAPDSSRPAL